MDPASWNQGCGFTRLGEAGRYGVSVSRLESETNERCDRSSHFAQHLAADVLLAGFAIAHDAL